MPKVSILLRKRVEYASFSDTNLCYNNSEHFKDVKIARTLRLKSHNLLKFWRRKKKLGSRDWYGNLIRLGTKCVKRRLNILSDRWNISKSHKRIICAAPGIVLRSHKSASYHRTCSHETASPFPQIYIIGEMMIGGQEGKLSGLFCAVLCATIVHSELHAHEQNEQFSRLDFVSLGPFHWA